MNGLCYRCMRYAVKGEKCTACGKPPVRAGEFDADVLPPGTQLDGGNVLLGVPIGRGGFGITYIALDQKDGRNLRIALKEFFPRHMATRVGRALVSDARVQEEYEHALRGFKREARALNALREQPNVVNVYFLFDENNTSYYGMELLEGKNLRQYLVERGKPLTAQEAFDLLSPIMDTLSSIHSRNIYHRDVSPANIFLCDNPKDPHAPTPKLIDFGAAYVAMAHFTRSLALTRTNGYTPIEQILYGIDRQGPYTDVYAFSATFYYAITGKAPAASDQRLTNNAPLVPPSKLNHAVSEKVDGVLMAGLALNAADRIQSADTLKMRLAQALEEKQPIPDNAAGMGRRIGGGLLETAFYYALGQVVAQGWTGLLCSFACMALIDMALCFSGQGTFGMRCVQVKLQSEEKISLKTAALYALCYAIFPLALLDCLAHMSSGPTVRERMTGTRAVVAR